MQADVRSSRRFATVLIIITVSLFALYCIFTSARSTKHIIMNVSDKQNHFREVRTVQRVYYMNLESNQQRRNNMERWLGRQSIPFFRINSTIGSSHPEACVPGKQEVDRCRTISGLANTRLDIIRNYNTSGLTVVLEDNFIVKKPLGLLVNVTLDMIPPDWDIIRWDCQHDGRKGWFDFVDTAEPIVFRTVCNYTADPDCYFCGGGHAMLWRNSSLHKLEKIWSSRPYDDGDCKLTTAELKSYCVNIGVVEKSKKAIVFKTRTISEQDSCNLQRFLSLAEGTKNISDVYDVVLLHEPHLPVSSASLERIQEYSHVHVFSNPSLPTKTNFNHAGGKSKLSFLLWINTLPKTTSYTHYWLLEDDVFFSGKWASFFQIIDARVTEGTDFVSKYYKQNEHWWWAKSCRVDGKECWVQPGFVEQSFNNILRMSHRFAVHLNELLHRDVLYGHDEAHFPAACRLWKDQNNTAACIHAPLFDKHDNNGSSFEGYNVMGGWSVWKEGSRNNPAFSLKGLATLRHYQIEARKTNEINRALQNVTEMYPQNTDVPRNLIFHPVKCDADETVGEAALAFAAN